VTSAFARLAAACLVVAPLVARALATQVPFSAQDADALFRDRERVASAARAADIWAASLAANARNFEAAWKLARARNWLGEKAEKGHGKAQYEMGVKAARAAIAIEPRRPEGHFFLAANMGALADASPLFAGLRYRTAIRDALETVVRLEPSYNHGAGYCGLGKYYLEVPRLFGGSATRAEQLIRTCLTYDSTSALAHYYLAQTLAALGRTAELEEALRGVIDAPVDPEYGPEIRIWQRKAARWLAALR
jgi:hypothetical protein